MSILANFNALPRQKQLAVVYGLPAGIAVLLLYWAWHDLGKLGKINPDVTDADGQPIPNKLPAFVQRDVPGSLWSEITDLQGQIVQQDKIIAEGPEVDKRLAALQGEIKAAQERLPQESEKAEMRDMIERLAREIPKDIGTVELKSVSIVDNGDRGDTRTITFQTDLAGDQDGIIKYIDSLEKNTRFMAVNTLTIHGGLVSIDQNTKKLAFGLHNVHMDIVTYVYNPTKKTAPAP
jgi:hypothetical protein